MADEAQKGTIIRGDDGSIYFIRQEILEATKVTEPEMQAFCSQLLDEHQDEVAGFSLAAGRNISQLAFVGPFAPATSFTFDPTRVASTVMCPGSMSLKGSFQVNPAWGG